MATRSERRGADVIPGISVDLHGRGVRKVGSQRGVPGRERRTPDFAPEQLLRFRMRSHACEVTDTAVAHTLHNALHDYFLEYPQDSSTGVSHAISLFFESELCLKCEERVVL